MKFNTRFFPVILISLTLSGIAFGGAQEKVSYDSVPMKEQVVAITFEDGPSPMLTPVVLKILADKNIKATFFALGESAQSHPDIIRQEFVAGHEVGSRGWEHSAFTKMTDAAWHSDMLRTDQALKLAIGRSPQLYCPPDLTATDQDCDQINKDFGYRVILWNIDSLAVKSQGAVAVANTIIAQVKPGSIIMSSDIDSTSVQALPMVIDALVSKGYKFVTVPQLIAMGTPAGMKKYQEENPDAAPKIAASANNGGTNSAPKTTGKRPTSTSTGTLGDGGFHPFGVGGTPAPDANGNN